MLYKSAEIIRLENEFDEACRKFSVYSMACTKKYKTPRHTWPLYAIAEHDRLHEVINKLKTQIENRRGFDKVLSSAPRLIADYVVGQQPGDDWIPSEEYPDERPLETRMHAPQVIETLDAPVLVRIDTRRVDCAEAIVHLKNVIESLEEEGLWISILPWMEKYGSLLVGQEKDGELCLARKDE